MLLCSRRRSRLTATALVASLAGVPAWAQTTTAPATTAPATTAPAAAAPAAPPATPAPAAPAQADAAKARPDPVVARVQGQDIHLSDVAEAAQGLPEEARSMPPQVLYPMVLDQLIDRRAVVDEALKDGLDKDPLVQRQISRARDQALQNALITRAVGPLITEAAIRARYDARVADKQGEEEVHARHILLPTEDAAKKVIAELKAGGDFAAIAKKESTDPAAQQGGDLGFFKKGDMLPEFSDAAFAMQPGQYSETPVHTRYGYHVIMVVERRHAAPQTFEQAHDEIRQQMISEEVQKVVLKARALVSVERFNADGSVKQPAAPAGSPAPAPADAAPKAP